MCTRCMRLHVAWVTLLFVAGCGNPMPSQTPITARCEPTLPNGETPPGEQSGPTWFGDGSLFTALPLDGEVRADPRSVRADGSIDIKFPWWRGPGVGAAGDLELSGREIATGATITADIPDGYGQRFQASAITFPTEGCYEITATSADARLSLVTRVTIAVEEPAAS